MRRSLGISAAVAPAQGLLPGDGRGRPRDVGRRRRGRGLSADARRDHLRGARGRPAPHMIVLGIETSCDETAVAVVEDGRTVRSNLISSQIDLHRRFGGVVPELASRAHVEVLNPRLDEALAQAEIRFRDLDAVAVTSGPGLIGALLVGVAAAKSIALAADVPLIGVNHLEGHIYANFLEHGDPEPPYVCLLVSGGHTMLVHMPEVHRYDILGQTLDDAAGEAFDKIARFMDMGLPGGPALAGLVKKGDTGWSCVTSS